MEKLIITTNLQSAYDEQYTDELTAWRELGGKGKAQNIIELCSHLDAKRVLEVGAGEGSILKYLDEWNFCEDLHALEISQSGINGICRRNLPKVKSVQHFNGYTIPFADHEFDLVILSHVLEHVEFPRILLREIRRVAKYAIIEIPCDFSFEVDKNVNHFLSYGHINIFIPTQLRFLLKSEGFEIVSDKLGHYAKEVHEHILYNIQKQPRTRVSLLKLHYYFYRAKIAFLLASAQKKQLMASTYTVLCRTSERGLEVFKQDS